MIEALSFRFTYVVVASVSGVGLYMIVASPNLVKKVIGVNLLQTAVFLFFVTTAYVEGGTSPVVPAGGEPGLHSSPLPHVIVLTAIVVGVSVTALGLALIIRIHRQYGYLREDQIREVRRGD